MRAQTVYFITGVLGSPVAFFAVASFQRPNLRKRSIRSKRLRTFLLVSPLMDLP
ncbi:hypothetical protein B598_0266 [Chlamydia psittaci GR9]|uniref:Uncharacterized protein n=1 Tax=Chlamydia psittaci 99DC5 TaxID=1112251 RepID=A0ABN0MPM4_CHLPS|nr:hypothetical protein CPS0B_0264 [Chlamydia psittaci 02DC15]AEG88222.1 hypothetical protein CPS0D_0266 [Chlamydia psittaci 08DC60]AFS19242.1 hypothetical protein B595_0271 [Chlamydia psittaci 84/55]AFS20356.1 hypothetical protein B598_0266 [Chlamydia psittaci GR9]AFS22440.1 hypothetical protein B600_0277 [Chlamydia psittaci VS225]AFS26260.1 hypothetical protein B603_0265 [Chlamydia psittaci WC]AFS27786.1 hypothetical protein B712_0265 [Chlamydia psittaci NJ1]EPJ21023.1 hypothetical protein